MHDRIPEQRHLGLEEGLLHGILAVEGSEIALRIDAIDRALVDRGPALFHAMLRAEGDRDGAGGEAEGQLSLHGTGEHFLSQRLALVIPVRGDVDIVDRRLRGDAIAEDVERRAAIRRVRQRRAADDGARRDAGGIAGGRDHGVDRAIIIGIDVVVDRLLVEISPGRADNRHSRPVIAEIALEREHAALQRALEECRRDAPAIRETSSSV